MNNRTLAKCRAADRLIAALKRSGAPESEICRIFWRMARALFNNRTNKNNK